MKMLLAYGNMLTEKLCLVITFCSPVIKTSCCGDRLANWQLTNLLSFPRGSTWRKTRSPSWSTCKLQAIPVRHPNTSLPITVSNAKAVGNITFFHNCYLYMCSANSALGLTDETQVSQ